MAAYTHEQLARALEELRDIYLPAPQSAWQASENLWTTAALAMLGAAGTWLFRRHVLRSPRTLALRELGEIRRAHRRGQSPRATLGACAVLARRVVLALYPVGEGAALTGERWLAFLDRVDGGTFFRKGEGRVLAQGPFLPRTPAFVPERLIAGLESWVRRARGPHRSWLERLAHPRQGLPPLYP